MSYGYEQQGPVGPNGIGTSTYAGGAYSGVPDYTGGVHLENFFSMTDLNASTSDPAYIPTGSPYVSPGIRRTARKHGWTPGMYTEVDEE